jgi:hypothetical protein
VAAFAFGDGDVGELESPQPAVAVNTTSKIIGRQFIVVSNSQMFAINICTVITFAHEKRTPRPTWMIETCSVLDQLECRRVLILRGREGARRRRSAEKAGGRGTGISDISVKARRGQVMH